MNWDAQSDRAAIRYYSDWCPDGIQEAHRRGARWQREALLSEEAVERAAKALFYGDIDPDLDVTWATAHESVRAEYLAMARVALTAAIGDDDE